VPSDVKSRMGPQDWALLLGLSVLWGGSFLFVGIAVRELPPLTIVALRVAIAALALHGLLRAMGLAFPRGRDVWLAFLGMGILNNAIPFSLIVWGQTQIASGLASILNATTPLWTVLVAHVFTRDERLTPLRLAGVVVGFGGVVGMVGPDALRAPGRDVVAQLAVLAAALSYAFAGVFGRRFKRLGVSPLATATGQVTASSLLLVPLALAVERPWSLPLPGGDTVAAVVGLAILSTALAYILYFRLLASAGATNLLLVTFLIPVSAIALGAVVLGEHLAPKHFAGMALIGLGLACIDGRVPARLRGLRPASSGSG
jgi:drug/metabolite transporter (DMT)-like permease